MKSSAVWANVASLYALADMNEYDPEYVRLAPPNSLFGGCTPKESPNLSKGFHLKYLGF